jgi:hypothetical protein
MTRFFALLLLAGVLVGCDLIDVVRPVPSGPPLPPADGLAGTAWTVMVLDETAVPLDAGIELDFSELG